MISLKHANRSGPFSGQKLETLIADITKAQEILRNPPGGGSRKKAKVDVDAIGKSVLEINGRAGQANGTTEPDTSDRWRRRQSNQQHDFAEPGEIPLGDDHSARPRPAWRPFVSIRDDNSECERGSRIARRGREILRGSGVYEYDRKTASINRIRDRGSCDAGEGKNNQHHAAIRHQPHGLLG